MRKKTMSRLLALSMSAAVALTSIPSVDVKAAETTAPLLLNLDFNTEAVDDVFVTETAKAAAKGGYSLQEKAVYNNELDSALYLNGTNAFLDVTKADGTPLLAEKEEITISFDSKVASKAASWPLFAAPNASAQTYPKEHYLGMLFKDGSITVERYDNEDGRPGNNLTGPVSTEWTHIDLVVSETNTKLYVNGEKKSESDSTYKLSDILEEGGVFQIGKANWGSGEFYSGLLDNYKVYDGILSEDEIAAQYAEFQESLEAIANTSEEALNEAAKNALKSAIDEMNATLEAADKGIYTKNSWNEVLSAVKAAEDVYADETAARDAVRSAKAAMETAYKGLKTVEQQFEESLAELVIASPDDIRNDIGLVKETRNGDAVDWTSSNPAVITDTEDAVDSMYGGGIVTRPEAGAEAVKVTLTATVTTLGADDSEKTAEKKFEVTVAPKTADLDTDYTAGYFWPHFDASGGYEKIFFGYSEDGLTWNKLNKVNGAAQPVLVNDAKDSDLGVRDPHLIRSVDGDKYWLIGTDLHAEGGGAGGSGWNQLSASQNIVVWESNDLVNWSEPRIVYAGFDTAGCVWAPEAYYDEVNGDYVVYWSIRDNSKAGTNDNALRVYVCRTRDFNSFSESKVWLSEDPATSTEVNIIDSTIVEDDGKFYRFSTSDWNTIIDVSDTLDTEDVLDVRVSEEESKPNGSWKRIVTRSGSSAAGFTRSEGYTVFKLPDGKWCAMGDNGGYIAFTTDDLASGQFTSASVSFPDGRFRHGSVMRLSATEEAALLEAYGSTTTIPDPTPTPGTTDSVLEYDFEAEVTDNTVVDTGKGDETADNATLYGNATVAYDEERESNVLVLDGTSGTYAEFPQGFFDNRNTMTISMDVKSNMGSGNFFTFTYGKDSTYYNFMRVRGTAVRNALTTTSWNSEQEVTGTGVTTGKWQKIVIVFNNTNMKLYIDGSLVDENTNTGITTSSLGTDLLGYLGKSFYSGDVYFNGSFDNVQIYDRALSDEEILSDVLDSVNLLKNVTIGTVPADPANTMGTDDHTAITSSIDKETNEITSYIRKTADRKAVEVTLDFVTGDVTATINGQPFVNGSKLDLRTDAALEVKLADRTETYTIKKPEIAANPVLPGQYADPDIDYFDGKYWIYPTTDGFAGWGGYVFHAWSSEDMYNWVDEGVIVDVKNDAPGLNEKGVEIAASEWSDGNGWAPTIEKKNDLYYFYYCGNIKSEYNSQYGSGKAIGVAWSENPAGPFIANEAPIIYPKMVQNAGIGFSGQVIDPSIFTDDDGTSYLFLGNGGNGTCVAELSEDMLSVKTDTIHKITGMTDFRESPVVTKRDGIYHFTWSCDDTGSPNYHVNYGVIEGYESLAEALAVDAKNLNVDYKYTLLQKNEAGNMLGTAHQSVLYMPETDKCYIAYHRFYTPLGIYTDGLGYHRETCIDEVTFDEETGYMNPLVPTMEGVSAQQITDADKEEQNQVAADVVIHKINAIGTVTLESKKNIDIARAEYDALTEEQKALVTNYDVLTAAEAAYKAMVENQNKPNTPDTPSTPDTPNTPVTPAPTVPTAPTKESIMVNNPGLPSGTAEESKNSEYAALAAKVTKTTKKSNKIQWSKVKDADGYVVFGNLCNAGKKKYAFEVLTIIENNSTTSYTHTGLKKGTGYKYMVQAYKMVDGKTEILSTSKTVHSITSGGKYGNVKTLKANKSKVTLAKKGKKFKLTITEKVKGGKKKVHCRVAFESSNPKVANVNKNGVITAKKKGKCTIYAYAQNGVCKKITVIVKK
ncbi:MAG: family 43 glycosylhydrolase [Lachnospiraceae bacterium]|nr:family 43 glycosylhydrolase [Lachnospiraceae bacterium]